MLHHPALPALLGFVALLMIVVPTWGLLYILRSRERGVPGVATIVEKEELPFRGAFHTWVEFAGRRCRITVSKATWREIRPGSTLAIRYDPDRPGEVKHNTAIVSPHATLIYTGLIIFGFLTAAAAWRLWFD
ncbi:MAG: hypothetical protein K2X03_17180 [Bryobacteraceae bacterium]|nr:hypothetical protein [Bryobacteraceae bacterium]